MKSSQEQHNELRNRLCPVMREEHVQPVKTSMSALERKEKLDDRAHLIELELIEEDYINYG